MPNEQGTLESWDQKMRRLCQELKALSQRGKSPEKFSLQVARKYRKKRWEILQHIERVDEDS